MATQEHKLVNDPTFTVPSLNQQYSMKQFAFNIKNMKREPEFLESLISKTFIKKFKQ